MEIYIHIIIWIILLLSVLSFFSLAPWVPTKKSDLERIHKLLKLKPWERFLEIGCGTGWVSLYIAKHNPKSHITGVELSIIFYIISRIRVFFSRQRNIQILYANALKKDLSDYDALYVFGLPETISEKLEPKLKTELKKTARCISYCFQMKSDYFIEHKDKPSSDVYAMYIYTPKSV